MMLNTSHNLEEVFKNYLEAHFLPYCDAIGQRDLFRTTIAQFASSSSSSSLSSSSSFSSETVLQGYLNRCIFGKESDRKEYLQRQLALPLGPMIKLSRCLEESSLLTDLQEIHRHLMKTEEMMELKIRNNDFEKAIKHSLVRLTWEDWKAGILPSADLFSKLNYYLHEKMIDLKVYQWIVDRVLVRDGYAADSSSLVSDALEPGGTVPCFGTQTSYLLANLTLESIHSLHLTQEKEKLSIVTLDRRLLKIDARGEVERRKLNALPSTSNVAVWWTFGENIDYFRIDGSLKSQLEDTIVVVIGDHLCLDRGILEIDQVQSFDATVTSKLERFEFALVVQARWKCILDHCESFIHEGATEIGGMDEFDNSPNGSGNEGSQQIIPDYSFPNQYFLIVVTAINRICMVRSIYCMQNILFPDQIPNYIRLFNNFGVVSGSNGLLGLFAIESGKVSKMGNYWSEQVKSVRSVDFECAVKMKLLPEDSLIVHDTIHLTTVSHYADSVIIAVDYCPHTSILVSADSCGVICIWNVCILSLQAKLLYSPYHFSGSSRIQRIYFSPSGSHLAVCLLDRVQLMKMEISEMNLSNYNTNYNTEGLVMLEKTSPLSERCCLDLSPNRICQYHLSFDGEEISIWKLMEEHLTDELSREIGRKGVSVSFWNHKNVDSFLNRQLQFAITPTLKPSFSSSFPRKEACSETDQASIHVELIDKDDLYDDEDNLNFVNYDGEYIPVYRECCLDLSHLCLPLPLDDDLTEVAHEISPSEQSAESFLPFSRGLFLKSWSDCLRLMRSLFHHDQHPMFLQLKSFFAVIGACFCAPNVPLVAAALECTISEVEKIIRRDLREVFSFQGDGHGLITLKPEYKMLLKWLLAPHPLRIGKEFWVDSCIGHNLLCSLYLKHCGNKSVAVEHSWQGYLQTYGSSHLRRASRGLRLLTTQIRKIDETANIRHFLPHQIGYISGLQEIYARRVGLSGKIPKELGELTHLRVLSMGNNRLTGELPSCLGQLKNLQRIVLHQNNLVGRVPDSLGSLGCIVNLAGNPRLQHGKDVPNVEKRTLIDIFTATNGEKWNTKINWNTDHPVCMWYKVGVLASHVHSLVMSSNGMEGTLPPSIKNLQQLRMIELATMPALTGPLPRELCHITSLRRLCICRCGLTGPIPAEIGLLTGLEELQLFGNNFTGSIPHTLGSLQSLKLLSLGEYTGGNNFYPEPIPSCIAKLIHLEALFLANCNISGSIPKWIGDLTELRQLDLQRNNITGSLPSSIGKLENLLYLNVKDNHSLGGRLPLLELLSLTKLNRLSLVHCAFQDAEVALEAMRVALPRCKIWI